MAYYVDVLLPLSIPNIYTYSVGDEWIDKLCIGKRVVVQFGSKKFYSAIICNIHQTPPAEYRTKNIEYILDEEPCVLPYQIDFWKWLARYYMSKIGDVMNAALPAGLKIESVSNIQINPDYAIDKDIFEQLSEKEKKVINSFTHRSKIKIQDLEKIIPRSSIPKVIKSLSEKKIVFFSEEIEEKYKPKLVVHIELNPLYKEENQLKDLITQLEKRAFKQLEALLSYLDISKRDVAVKKQVLIEKAGESAVNALIKKGVFIECLVEESRLVYENTIHQDIQLTNVQKRALLEIKQKWIDKQTVLLYGETGSGKTEIYIELIKEQIHQEKQVLYLIPEIALTTQLITRLQKVFGNKVYVYHSRFSQNERTEIWNKLLKFNFEKEHPDLKNKCAQIILGPRSALFLPFQNLGLIIIDEEHDTSFRQRQKHPYYNARDAGIYLANMLQAKVLLGSATPSVETLYNCDLNKYGKVVLKDKYGTAKVIRKLIDIRKYYHQIKNQTPLTPPLFEAIKDRLEKKEQVLIFHNRRGYVPIVQCTNCGWVARCKHCDVSLVYHKQHHLLICHYCGNITDTIQQCPACGSVQINYKGWGTEKLEESLQSIFPKYTIARLDQDTTRSKYAHKSIIDAFEKQEIDILIGTQMITKGLDFKNVTLVGVINADSILHFPDFRAFERAYQLLHQLSGRAGRLNKNGEVLVQTFHPENNILQMYLENNYDLLYQYLLKEREKYHYPPFTRVIEMIIKSKQENICAEYAHKLFTHLYPHFKENILGPIKPYVSKINNYFIQLLLIKVPKINSYTKAKQIIASTLSKIQNHQFVVDIIVDA